MHRTASLVVVIIAGCTTGCEGEPIPGDERHFDPVAALPALRARLGPQWALTSLHASGVRSDGTLDMTEERYNPEVTYELVAPSPPPANQPPIGAGGSNATEWRVEKRIVVERPGFHTTYSTPDEKRGYRSRGVITYEQEPEPGPPEDVADDPTCSFAQLWALALAKGAPPEAVAHIRYEHDGYEFDISGTDVRLRFTKDCALRDR